MRKSCFFLLLIVFLTGCTKGVKPIEEIEERRYELSSHLVYQYFLDNYYLNSPSDYQNFSFENDNLYYSSVFSATYHDDDLEIEFKKNLGTNEILCKSTTSLFTELSFVDSTFCFNAYVYIEDPTIMHYSIRGLRGLEYIDATNTIISQTNNEELTKTILKATRQQEYTFMKEICDLLPKDSWEQFVIDQDY